MSRNSSPLLFSSFPFNKIPHLSFPSSTLLLLLISASRQLGQTIQESLFMIFSHHYIKHHTVLHSALSSFIFSQNENLKQVYWCFNPFLVLRPKPKFFPILPFWAWTLNTEHAHWVCWLQLQLNCCRHPCSSSLPTHKILISEVHTWFKKKKNSPKHSKSTPM